jgi:AMMECR1 domain-containing protein
MKSELDTAVWEALFEDSRESILRGLGLPASPWRSEALVEEYSVLGKPRALFVTLRKQRALRGCIGKNLCQDRSLQGCTGNCP